MGISEAERRIAELNALIRCQLRLIRKLETRGKDLTSAKIVFDSLRVSLFLTTQDWQRVRCYGKQAQAGNEVNGASSAWVPKPSLVVVPDGERGGQMARRISGVISMKAENNFLSLADKIDVNEKEIEGQLVSSIVPDSKVAEIESSEAYSRFRPLTDEEKKEFVSSLNADGKSILAEMVSNAKRSGESAA